MKTALDKSQVELSKQKPKTSKWAITSLVCGLLAVGLPIAILMLVTFLDMYLIYLPLSFSAQETLEQLLGYIIAVAPLTLSIIALVSGVVGLAIIRSKKGAVKGTGKALGGILLGILFFAMVFGLMMLSRIRHMAPEASCKQNLGTLYKAIQRYTTKHNNKYPTANNWCDLLMQYNNLTERDFFCFASRHEYGNYPISHYAINPNAEPNSPPDLVLLFETKGGWNQVGGPELITAENHQGRGSNVLFNDGRVEFVKKKRFGKLKWQVVEDTTAGKPDSKKNK